MATGERVLAIGIAVTSSLTACREQPALTESEVVVTVEAAVLQSLGDLPYKHPLGTAEAVCFQSPRIPAVHHEHESAMEALVPLSKEVLGELGARFAAATGLRVHAPDGCGGWYADEDGPDGIYERGTEAPALLIEVFQPMRAKGGGHLVPVAVQAGSLWGWEDQCLVSTIELETSAECTRIAIS